MNNRATTKRAKPVAYKVKSIARKPVDIQGKPYSYEFASHRIHFKVDICVYLEHAIFIGGWASDEIQLKLFIDGIEVKFRIIKFERHDVNEHLNFPPQRQSGFVLIFEDNFLILKPKQIILSWPSDVGLEQKSFPLIILETGKVNEYDHHALGPAFWPYINKIPFNSAEWKRLLPDISQYLRACDSAKAFLEIANAFVSLEVAVVVGWVVRKSKFRIWLQDQAGDTYHLADAFWYHRKDLAHASNELNMIGPDNGFFLRINGLKPGSLLSICGQDDYGIYVLGEIIVGQFPEAPLAAAKLLFQIPFPKINLISRFKNIDQPILERLISNNLLLSKELIIRINTLGVSPKSPLVSLVIPLYGRCDFVEHQMLEFSKDPWIAEKAEVIYIIDDNLIYENFVDQIGSLHRLLKVSVKFIWLGQNIGFSAANNLGAKHSTGKYLLFLNSDVFPQKPSWLKKLVDVMEDDPNIGAISPRLVFSDGSIQHSGSIGKYRNDLEMWVNRYSNKGLDPHLDPTKENMPAECLSSACLLVNRLNFDRIDGWDTSYLIGDVESSDFCMKLRKIGLKIAYHPHVQLTHLEGQSFKFIGDDSFVKKVELYNAALYQERWLFIENSIGLNNES